MGNQPQLPSYTHFGLKCNMFLPIPSANWRMESVLNELQTKPQQVYPIT